MLTFHTIPKIFLKSKNFKHSDLLNGRVVVYDIKAIKNICPINLANTYVIDDDLSHVWKIERYKENDDLINVSFLIKGMIITIK